MSELTERLRSFETDHKPHGWPAVKMRDVSALIDRIEHLERVLLLAKMALEYHTQQTRPIHGTVQTIAAIEEALKS